MPVYPSDLTDQQWARVAPLFPVPKQGRGRPRKYTNRALLDALLYQARTGCAWRYLPRDFPPHGAVWFHFRRWRDSGLIECVHDTLRAQVRRQAGREPTPSAAIVDSQSVKSQKGASQAPSAMTSTNALRDAGGILL